MKKDSNKFDLIKKDIENIDIMGVNTTKSLFKVTKELNKLIDEMLEEKSCKYCGEKTDSIDPNILCPKCREDFGHTFYSEL